MLLRLRRDVRTGVSMLSRKFALLSVALGLAFIAFPAWAQMKNELHINQIQVIGTHNSYHAGFALSAEKLWQQKNPAAFSGLDYRHKPLTEQLDSGIRQ